MGKLESVLRRITKQKSQDTQPFGDGFRASGSQVSDRRRSQRQWIIVLGLTILYILTFPLFNDVLGPVSSALISIPVVIAGWFFGVRIGFVASLLSIFLSALLLNVYSGFTWHDLLGGSPGFGSVIIVAYLAGYIHDTAVGRKRASTEVDFRERFIALISIATKSISSPNDLEDAHFRLISHLTNLFVADYAYLVSWDEKREQANLIATTRSMERDLFPFPLGSAETNLIKMVLQDRHSMIVEDVQKSTFVIDPSPDKSQPSQMKSVLILPLVVSDYRFGAAILAFDTVRSFSPEEIVYVELASNQVTLALRTVQQQLAIEAQLKEAKALADIERALSESESIGVDKVLQLIVNSAKELIPKADNVILHLIDNEHQLLVPRAIAGFKEKTKSKLNMRLGEGVAGQVIATGKMITIADVRSDPRFLEQTIPVRFRSLVVAPIRSSEKILGTISIHSGVANAFRENEISLLETLGNQVVIAIENASLLEITRRSLVEIDILYRISQGLVGSLDPDELMKDVADLLKQNLGYHHVLIYVLDSNNDELVARQGSGEIALQLVEQGHHLKVGEDIVGHVAYIGEPFVTNDVENVIFHVDHPLLPDVKSELAVPIIIDKQVIGVLDVRQTASNPIAPHQIGLLSTVADQLAVALQKANLYNDLQASLTHEQAMRTKMIQNERLAVAGQLLASVSHELNNPLQAVQNALFLVQQEESLSVQGKQDLEIILSEVERMATLLGRLRTTYRPMRSEDAESIQLNEIVEDIHSLTATHMRHNDIVFEFHPDPELPPVRGVADQIRQVMLNLFINAIEAMQSGGRLVVYTQQFFEEGRALLSVVDTGGGISPEILPKIFEPFFTNKKTGTGLGLSITTEIIHQHGGEIQVENNEQGGATFKVWFPVEE
jgi:signal transduction histidine kinase